MPLSTCDYSTCSIVKSDGTACPQAALSKASKTVEIADMPLLVK